MTDRTQLIDMFCGADITFTEPHWGMLEVETPEGFVQFNFYEDGQLQNVSITD